MNTNYVFGIRRENHVDRFSIAKGFRLRQELATIEEVPAHTGPVPSSLETEKTKSEVVTTLFKNTQGLGLKSPSSGVGLRLSILPAEFPLCKMSGDGKMASNNRVPPSLDQGLASHRSPPLPSNTTLHPSSITLALRPKPFPPTSPVISNLGVVTPKSADIIPEPSFHSATSSQNIFDLPTPKIADVIPEFNYLSPTSAINILDLGSTYSVPRSKHSKPLLPQTFSNAYLQTKVAQSTMAPPVTDMGSFYGALQSMPPKLELTQSGQDLIPRPEFVTASPAIRDLDSTCSAPRSNIPPPRTFTDLIPRPRFISPFSPRLSLNISSILSPPYPIIFLPPTCTDLIPHTVIPTKTPSPPINLTILKPASNINIGRGIQALNSKMASPPLIRGETKVRSTKAAKPVRSARKRDSTYRHWFKARKQAEKKLQAAVNKLHELRREEEEIRTEVARMQSSES